MRGAHRVACRNPLDDDSYLTLLRDDPAHVVIADTSQFMSAHPDVELERAASLLATGFKCLAPHLVSGAVVYVFANWRYLGNMLGAAHPTFGAPVDVVAWLASDDSAGTFYRSGHQHILVYRADDAAAERERNNLPRGKRARSWSNVWRYGEPKGGNHDNSVEAGFTDKPVALVADALRDCSNRGGVVLDPFAGCCGTTMIAAEKTGRKARLIEMDPNCDIIVRRWQEFTGGMAHLAVSGEAFADVAARRALEL
jgi:hypothetical protein